MSPTDKPLNLLTHVRREGEGEAQRKPLRLSMFGRMWKYTHDYKRIRNWLFLAVILRSMQGPVMVWVLAEVIQGPIGGGDYQGLYLGVTLYGLLAAFTYYTLYHRQRLALLLGEGTVHDLRNDIFGHLQIMTMDFFGKTKLGRLISRMTSDAEVIRAGIQDAVFVSIVNLGNMLVSMVIMLYYSRFLFLVFLLFAPFYFFVYHYFRRKLSDATRSMQESFSRVTGTLAESVTGIRVTQSFARQDVNASMFHELVVDHSGYNLEVVRTAGTFSPVLELVSSGLVAAIFVVGWLWYYVWNTPQSGAEGVLIPFYFLTQSLLGPVAALGNQYNTAVMSMAGAERVFNLLDRQPDFVDDPHAKDISRLEGRVEFRDLTFGYDPAKPVLHEINFIAQPGQAIALVGHTGSGKTSIINLISKFYLPTSGLLLLDGHDIRQITTPSLHRHMGIVLQQNFLFTGSVMDNIRMGRESSSDQEVTEAARRLDCLDLLQALPQGLHTHVGERGSGLSLGQRQLICFCRAMLVDPSIIILDEATSAVDTITEARIQKALALLLHGRTSFVVAHRLSTIRHASMVLVLDHGRIVERGTHDELLATGGVYANLYQQFIRSSQS